MYIYMERERERERDVGQYYFIWKIRLLSIVTVRVIQNTLSVKF